MHTVSVIRFIMVDEMRPGRVDMRRIGERR
jgi:hypothetical protein